MESDMLQLSLHLLETMPLVQWAKCSVHLASAGLIPKGCYFLYSADGGVHQFDFADGQGYYLALPLPESAVPQNGRIIGADAFVQKGCPPAEVVLTVHLVLRLP